MIAPARLAAWKALVDLERQRVDLDTALAQGRDALSDPRDVALLREIVTGTVRWQSRLDWQVAPLSKVRWDRLDPEVRTALRMAAHQLTALDRLPAAAVVDDAVALVRRARKSSAAGLVNAVLRRVAAGELRPLPVLPAEGNGLDVATALAVITAHPEWLVTRWLARRDRAEVEAWLAFDNTPASPSLRVNPLVGATRDDVLAHLAASDVVAVASPIVPLGIRVERGSVVDLPALAHGACAVQDEGSQLAALVAPIRIGDRVLDVCAAPGGKALAYAAAAGATGRVIACDVRAGRLGILAATLARARASTVRVVGIDADRPLPFAPAFDVVAVDAPCSGLGTLRRDPDIKWRRSPAMLIEFQRRQLDLLRRAAAVVTPGGALVYTTCSTEPEENDDVVRAFLATAADFVAVRADAAPTAAAVAPFVGADGCFRTHPVDGLEGFFGAVLRRSRGGRLQEAVIQ